MADRAVALQGRSAQRPVPLDGLFERGPVDVLGDEVPGRTVERRVQHRSRAEPADAPRRHDLVAEALGEVRVLGEVLVDDLDRDLPAVLVLAQVHRAHAAASEPAQQPVAAQVPWIVRL
jgi:hypothetical protein